VGGYVQLAIAVASAVVIAGPLRNQSLHETPTRVIVAMLPGLLAFGFLFRGVAAFSGGRGLRRVGTILIGVALVHAVTIVVGMRMLLDA
jgi:hypothetical protein